MSPLLVFPNLWKHYSDCTMLKLVNCRLIYVVGLSGLIKYSSKPKFLERDKLKYIDRVQTKFRFLIQGENSAIDHVE